MKTEMTLAEVRSIINEELLAELKKGGAESPHAIVRTVVTVATSLLEALEAFEEEATPAMVNATTPHLGELKRALDNMVEAPRSYVPAEKKEPRRVSLRPVDNEE
jgi:hypothetical protein